MSRTFSTKSGSFDGLKASVRCGWPEGAPEARIGDRLRWRAAVDGGRGLARLHSSHGNLLRQLILLLTIQSRSLVSLQQRLFKTGGRLIRHARHFVLPLAESYCRCSTRMSSSLVNRNVPPARSCCVQGALAT